MPVLGQPTVPTTWHSAATPQTDADNMLYAYQKHPELGFLYARIQTWFPFQIQVGMNGREWLARQMDREKLSYRQHQNCFTFIEDFPRAQQLMDEQLKTDWPALLDSFGRQLNPLHEEIFELFPPRTTGRGIRSSGQRISSFARRSS